MMGAEALKNTALSFHPQEAPPERRGLGSSSVDASWLPSFCRR